MNAKDLLLQYNDCVLKEKRLKTEILWTKKALVSLDHITTQSTRKMKKDLSRIEKRLQFWDKQLIQIRNERQHIKDFISGISGVESDVLTLRYIEGKQWEEICDLTHYSWNGVFKIHERALRIVQERLDQGGHKMKLSTLPRQLK